MTDNVKHKPATVLPWKPFYSLTRGEVCGGGNAENYRLTAKIARDDAAYIAHAANAYPRLVAALRSQIADLEAVYDAAKSKKSGVEVTLGMFRRLNTARALLRELGETS